jgi:hypothetical protein
MRTDRYSLKLTHPSTAAIAGLAILATLGLQSCNFLQSNKKTSNSPKPTVRVQPDAASSLSKPLPTSPQGQLSNPDIPISGGTSPTKIDPITGLPIANSPDALNPATGKVDPTLNNRNTVSFPNQGGTSPLKSAQDLSKPVLKPTTSPNVVGAKSPTKPPTATAKAPQAGSPNPSSPSVNEPLSNALPNLQQGNPGNAAPPFDAGGPIPAASPTGSSFGDPSAFSSGNSGSKGASKPATSTAGGTGSESTGGATTSSSSTGSSGATTGSSSSGYVYDPATAAYKPANSLPVWNPGGNSTQSSSP